MCGRLWRLRFLTNLSNRQLTPTHDGVGQYVIYDNNGVKDVVLDTHQSQANRIEPGFDNSGLIPTATVKVGG